MFRALVILAVVALSSAQLRKECQCGMFMTISNWDGGREVEIYRMRSIDMDNCDQFDECLEACADKVNEQTNHGDLDSDMGNGFTVGQELCVGAANIGHEYAHYETVYAYANICNGPWDFTGVQMEQQICCKSGHYYTCGTK